MATSGRFGPLASRPTPVVQCPVSHGEMPPDAVTAEASGLDPGKAPHLRGCHPPFRRSRRSSAHRRPSGRCNSRAFGASAKSHKSTFCWRRQDHGHRLRMNRRNDGVRFRRQEAKRFMLSVHWRALWALGRRAKGSTDRRRRTAAGPHQARTILASCAAWCPRIRKMMSLGRCSGGSCRATRASGGCRHCGYW